MNVLEKFQSVIIFVSIILGLYFGQMAFVADLFSSLIITFLFFMLFTIFLNIDLVEFKNSFKKLKFTLSSLSINFIWTPILAYVLGFIFLSHDVGLWVGFIMLLVTPCTDWYLVFTDIAKGDIPLSLSILPLNLVLQIILLPVYLFVFTGTSTVINLNLFVESLLLVVALPFIIAQVLRFILLRINNSNNNSNSNKYKSEEINFEDKGINESFNNGYLKKFFNSMDYLQIIFLALAIFSMFASQGKLLLENLWVFSLVLIPFLFFFIVNFVFVRWINRFLKFSKKEYVSLTLTTLARNSPVSLAIAVVAFPNEPLISLTLVIAPLIELPILIIISRILLFLNK
ncbi:arsenic resistance protein [Methanobrevibacter curvatus]|uniref:Sodium bile acid symporter family protein n=1 Tax=Methanobrevibacter curvatus TaxID=49547 RepID=A0A166ENG8_9EURY|nr:bile acid:sodium symporter [Methanobrevibacter curvatus]KZX16843.1 sodium bile acid symporter family protein [Methanobrevibacter curvatus]